MNSRVIKVVTNTPISALEQEAINEAVCDVLADKTVSVEWE